MGDHLGCCDVGKLCSRLGGKGGLERQSNVNYNGIYCTFLDQELVLLGATCFKKAQGPFVSNRIGMKFGRNALQLQVTGTIDEVTFLIHNFIHQ